MTDHRTIDRAGGFTLIEALASSVVLCTAVALIGAISSRTLWQIRANNDTLAAWQILDEQMTAIAQMGLARFLALDQAAGELEYYDDRNLPRRYRWQADIRENSAQPGLFNVTVALNWQWNGKNRAISATTLLYDESLSSALPEPEPGPDTPPQPAGPDAASGQPEPR